MAFRSYSAVAICVVLCATCPCGLGAPNYRAIAAALKSLEPSQLREALGRAGYDNISLGLRDQPRATSQPSQPAATPGSTDAKANDERPNQEGHHHPGEVSTVFHQCKRVTLISGGNSEATTSLLEMGEFQETRVGRRGGHQSNQAEDSRSPPCVSAGGVSTGGVSAGSLLEIQGEAALAGTASALRSRQGVRTRAKVGATVGLGKSLLACTCEEYSCHCQKECFCRLTADPFNGIQYPPEANCPVCKYCGPRPDASGSGSGSETAGERKAKELKDHDFKCTCSFDGIGGAGISDGGSMSCDCRLADCTCVKKCTCQQPPRAPEPTPCPADPLLNSSAFVTPDKMKDVVSTTPPKDLKD